MYAHVSREEWLFRGLAIVMCLAMVGMAVMPLAVGEGWAVLDYYMQYKWHAKIPPAGYWAMAGVETYTSTVYPYIISTALDAAEFSMAGPVGLAAGVAIAL